MEHCERRGCRGRARVVWRCIAGRGRSRVARRRRLPASRWVRESGLGVKREMLYHRRRIFSMSCVGAHVATRVELWEHKGLLRFLGGPLINSRSALQLSGSRELQSVAKESCSNVRGLVEFHPTCSHHALRMVARRPSGRCLTPWRCLERWREEDGRWSCMGGAQDSLSAISFLVNRSISQSVIHAHEDGKLPERPAR
jgi:hypothetical protein